MNFDAKSFVDVRLQQQGSVACRESTVRAMSISKDGEVGVLKVAHPVKSLSTIVTLVWGAMHDQEQCIHISFPYICW